jgi:hypothetical protein
MHPMCLLGSQELGEACSGGSEFPAGLHVEVPYTAPGYRIPAEDAHTDMESCDVLEPFTPVNVDYPSLRDLRKQKPNLISRAPRIRGYEFRANRMRLPELDQEAIEVPPFPRPYSCNGFLGVDKGLERGI